jgi:hypothetical protein
MSNVRFGVALLILCAPICAQQFPIAGSNVNMVSGTTWPGGDPFLQRQNEPSMAVIRESESSVRDVERLSYGGHTRHHGRRRRDR